MLTMVGRAPTAAEVLRTWAVARGWTAASALPDEARAGRAIMKDYVAGRLLSCQLPPHAPNTLAQLAVSATPGPRVSQAVAGSQALPHGSTQPMAAHDHSSLSSNGNAYTENKDEDTGDEDEEEEDGTGDEEPASASGRSSSEAGSPPTLVGASLDPTDQAAAAASRHSSHELGASVAGTASRGLAQKLDDPSPPPRGTLPETSAAGVLQPDQPGTKAAAAHGDAGAKRVQGHDPRVQEGLGAITTGHGGPRHDPARAAAAAGGNTHTADVPAAAAPIVGSRHDAPPADEVEGCSIDAF